MRPVPLKKTFLDKVWGSPNVAPWYVPDGRRIGEVWFTSEGAPSPLLMKLIFTSEWLSVQVHPGDEYAEKAEQSKGKTEMWYILRAEPGAKLACGLTETISKERLRAASLSGEIEQLLNWVEVKAGDAIFIPAGTVHAIGPGLVLCEIQQQSDVTYRLYDYGRPRELHLDKAMDVSVAGPHEGVHKPTALSEVEKRLVECEYFVVDTVKVGEPWMYHPKDTSFEAVVAVDGDLVVDGEPMAAGEAWMIPSGCGAMRMESVGGATLIRAYVP